MTGRRRIATYALVLLAVGVIFMGIGWATGGTPNVQLSNGWSVGIRGIDYRMPNGNSPVNGPQESNLQAFTTIDANLDAAGLHVQYGDSFAIEITEGHGKTTYSVESGILRISHISPERFGDWHNYKSPEIWVTIPRNTVLNQVIVSGGIGEIKLNGIEAQSISIETGISSCYLDIVTQYLHLETGIGEATVVGTVNGDISLSAGIGDVHMDLNGNPDEYHHDVSQGLGVIRINGNSYLGTASNDTNRPYTITVDGGIGSVDINIQ